MDQFRGEIKTDHELLQLLIQKVETNHAVETAQNSDIQRHLDEQDKRLREVEESHKQVDVLQLAKQVKEDTRMVHDLNIHIKDLVWTLGALGSVLTLAFTISFYLLRFIGVVK